MADVTLTIDDRPVTVPAGTNIVDAARAAGVDIPVFCYHPKMKPVGMCRMCMVEVWTPLVDRVTRQPILDEDGKPKIGLMQNKLQPACMTPVGPDMIVRTATDRVQFAQRGQLEFLLTSHPLDCPVCDKGGECPLQNLTMRWGPGNSRFDYSDKVHFQKPIPLGDLIYLDRERCILCARCVRFQDEIADDPVLGFDNRGRNWEIISRSDPTFDSKFSGNTTDICPVGALTTSDFRFKARVWEVQSVPSVCPHCPVGCNVTLDMRYNQLMRVMPRENDFVNEIWICDKGRFGMRFFSDQDRLTTPLIRRNGELVPATWEEAINEVGTQLARLKLAAGGEALAGLAGTHLPNEDLFLFQKLFRELLGSHNLDHRDGTALDVPLDDLPLALGVGSGTNLMTLGKGTAVLVIGADPEEEAPLYLLRLRAIAQRGGDLTVAGSYPTKLERSATRALRYRPGAEALALLALLRAILDENLHNQEFVSSRVRGFDDLRQALGRRSVAQLAEAAGLDEELVRVAARAFAGAENGIIVYGSVALQGGAATMQALANLALVTGKAGRENNGVIGLLPGGNSRGALDMGVRPDAGPGAVALERSGLAARDMWGAVAEGRVRGMYIAGMDPAAADAAAAAALDQLEFLVVQGMFLTETARRAHVVLPVAAFAEREGTFTNAERRVQRFRKAANAPESLPADWQVFQDVARVLQEQLPEQPVVAAVSRKERRAHHGAEAGTAVVAPPATWDYLVSADIAEEISSAVSLYAGATYSVLSQSRGSWGRQPREAFYYDGTSYENTEGVGLQLPSTIENSRVGLTVAYREPQAAVGDPNAPFTLLMPARLYHEGDWLRGSKLQRRVAPRHAILSPADAQRLGVALGEIVTVRSASGAIDLPVQIEAGLAEGVVLVPAVHPGDATIATGPLTRVTVVRAQAG